MFMDSWISWGISTLLLLFLNRRDEENEEETNSQQPSKFTETNVNNIGNPVPVVLGRCLIKNPLISYYGSYRADPYTEEYGMHSEFDAKNFLWPILLMILSFLIPPTTHRADKTMRLDDPSVSTSGGSGQVNNPTVSGTVTDNTNGKRFDVLVNSIIQLLITMLLHLFNNNEGRTTIQKGFKYY